MPAAPFTSPCREGPPDVAGIMPSEALPALERGARGIQPLTPRSWREAFIVPGQPSAKSSTAAQSISQYSTGRSGRKQNAC